MSDSKLPKTAVTKTNPFTIDGAGSTGHDMPSISRLLDRKKLLGEGGATARTTLSAAPQAKPATRGASARSLVSISRPDEATEKSSSSPVLELRPEIVKTEVKSTIRSGEGFKEISLSETVGAAVQLDATTPVMLAAEEMILEKTQYAPPPGATTIQRAPAQQMLQAQHATLSSPPLHGSQSLAAAASNSTAVNPAGTQAKSSASRRNVRSIPLKVQDRASLNSVSDPLAMALKKLFEVGALSAVILQSSQTEASAVLAFEAGVRKAIWEGMKWNSSIVATALWGEIQRSGLLEIPPMLPSASAPGGKTTMPANPRGVLRRGLGAERGEWVTLLPFESSSLGKAILVVFSKSSLQGSIPQVRTWLKPLGAASSVSNKKAAA